MELLLDCLPCILRQTLESSRLSTTDTDRHDEIMTQTVKILSEYKRYRNSPEITRDIQGVVKKLSGASDPYVEVKKRDIQIALNIVDRVKQFIDSHKDRLYGVLKAAAIGNVLDSAINLGSDLEQNVESELKKPFAVYDADELKKQLESAKSLLVIGDNAGEIVLDSLLLQHFSHMNCTYAVRSAPALNDATVADALALGTDRYANVISTGCDVPGVLLDECSDEFLDIFYNADLVISKGQGNIESLSDCDRSIFFLLKAKCPAISNYLGVSLNDYLFRYIDRR